MSEKKIIITKEMMLAAQDYVPLGIKEVWAAENAPKVFNQLAITAGGQQMPPMFAVDTGLKSRYLMAALAQLYFSAEYEADERDSALMSVECYDTWAGSHVMNQIERLKRESDAGIKAKAFDLLSDYKDLEKRFSTQILNLLNVQNDTVLRQSTQMSANVKELPKLLEQLEELQKGKGEDVATAEHA